MAVDLKLIENIILKVLSEGKKNSIVKQLNLPEDIADFILGITGKFAFMLATMFKMHNGDKINRDSEQSDIIKSIEDFFEEFGYMIDAIENGALKQNFKKVKKEFNELKKTKNLQRFVRVTKKLLSQNDEDEEELDPDKIMMKFGDGFFWLNLGKKDCPIEARKMGHCGMIKRGSLVSLRDSNNDPYITMAYNDISNSVYEIRGPANSEPHPKYHKHILEFFQKFNPALRDKEYTPDYLKQWVPNMTQKLTEQIEKLLKEAVSVEDFQNFRQMYINRAEAWVRKKDKLEAKASRMPRDELEFEWRKLKKERERLNSMRSKLEQERTKETAGVSLHEPTSKEEYVEAMKELDKKKKELKVYKGQLADFNFNKKLPKGMTYPQITDRHNRLLSFINKRERMLKQLKHRF